MSIHSLVSVALNSKASKSKLSGADSEKSVGYSSKAALSRQCPFALYAALCSQALTVKVPAPALGRIAFNNSLTFEELHERSRNALVSVFDPPAGAPELTADSEPELVRQFLDILALFCEYASAVDTYRGEERKAAAERFLAQYTWERGLLMLAEAERIAQRKEAERLQAEADRKEAEAEAKRKEAERARDTSNRLREAQEAAEKAATASNGKQRKSK